MLPSYPLTPLQQSMYASAALTGQPWQYVEQIVVQLNDALDPAAMGQAWNALAAAHPVLRYRIVATGSALPQQQPQPEVQITPVTLDWRGLDPAQQAAEQRAFLQADRDAGVDATAVPGFRVTLLLLSETQSVLVWSFPHSLLDGRAFAPLLDEVFQRYAAITRGASFDDAQISSVDVFATHCQHLGEMDHSAGAAHFAQALAGWEGSAGLCQPDASPSRKQEITFDLTPAQTAALTRLAAETQGSVNTLIQAAWGTVLARVTGQRAVCFGSTRAGRHLVPGAAFAVGCFITTMPQRLRLRPNTTLAGVVADLRQAQIDARPHEHTPLTEVSRALGLAPGRRLFDSVVMFETASLQDQLIARDPAWQDRQVSLLEEGDTPVSVAAYMGDSLRVVVEYDPAEVPQGPALSAGLHHFLAALELATAHTPMAQISMLSPLETQALQALAGPEHGQDAPLPSCLARFEQVAQDTPDQIAVMQPGAPALSYGALDRAASQLAGALVAAGIRPGSTIGICMARSPAFVTAMLAIWKAGAAFVPMDPAYPRETLEIIATDSGARLVLTDDSAPALSVKTRAFDSLMAAQSDPLAGGVSHTPDALAYVIFTSGSTGRPKGVMVSHQGLAAHAASIVPTFGLQATDRVLQFAALSFDVALEEIIPTLTIGATLVLRDEEMVQSVPHFLDQLDALKITVTNLPTGFWVALTEVLERHGTAFAGSVRLMIVGGERVPLSVLTRWRSLVPDLRWLNGYGPTETTITCTLHEVTGALADTETVPIGSPLGHARAWVLGADGGLLPPGAQGELFITGPAVAQGYINDPERTAQNFAPASFAPQIGRAYGTGDRVLWRDGVLHYIGRMDRQIKLRGFRIEPGQIEAALEQLPGVERAHADLTKAAGGQAQLVAWYAASDGAVSVDDLAQALQQALPPQMQPLLVPVEHWPQTPGGKLDVARLPQPKQPALDVADTKASDGALVAEVAALFAQVLDMPAVGPQTSFFEAGGDSLSLLRLMPELERAFGVKLAPGAVYGDPTPRGVARALIAQETDPLVVIPIQPEGVLPPLYAVHVLGDNGSFFRPLAQELGTGQPVFGLTVGLLSETTPTTVPDIARFYLHQIERHHPEGPLSLIAVSAGSYVTLELAQLLHKAGREVQALILLDAEGPGGRARIGRLARLAVHGRGLLRQGWPYLKKHLRARQEMRLQDRAQHRLQQGKAGAKISDIDGFVASNMMAIAAYVPQPYPKPLTIFRAGDDRFDAPEAIRTGLGWSGVAAAGFELRDVPGDHLGILAPPNVAVLARRVQEVLASGQDSS